MDVELLELGIQSLDSNLEIGIPLLQEDSCGSPTLVSDAYEVLDRPIEDT